MKKIPLESYDVVIGDVDQSLSDILKGKEYTHIAVLVDEHTSEYCLPRIQGEIPQATVIRISSGEQNKTLPVCEDLSLIHI